jgi:hypothetical protein
MDCLEIIFRSLEPCASFLDMPFRRFIMSEEWDIGGLAIGPGS